MEGDEKFLDINQRVKAFDKPFAYVVMNQKIDEFCSYCLYRPSSGKLLMCGRCHHSRYCDKACQKQAWPEHKVECRRLQAVFPKLPLTELIFLARINDKVTHIKKNGDTLFWQTDRKWDELLGHQEEIKQHEKKMADFKRIAGKMKDYLKDECPDEEDLFNLYCKTWINSHSIHNSSGIEIGMALDLGVSRYDHACRPNAALVFDGYHAMIRPLVPRLDAADWSKTCISYIDIGRSRYQRRKDLYSKWYFWCNCKRCADPEEDYLTSRKCVNEACSAAIPLNEEMEVKELTCPACKSIIPAEKVKEAQDLMLSLPEQYSMEETDENKAQMYEWKAKVEAVLHEENIYRSRLITALLHLTGTGTEEICSPENHKMIYDNYRRCFPAADRHLGYKLLDLVRTLLGECKREEATGYAYEAMTIFEVCFGMDHPYYLQTLALWTFLSEKSDKPTEQLLQLLNFDNNRKVDLKALLAKAEAHAKMEQRAAPVIPGQHKAIQ